MKLRMIQFVLADPLWLVRLVMTVKSIVFLLTFSVLMQTS